MNRLLTALAASAFLASGAAIACNDMKVTDGGDGGVPMSSAPERATTAEKAPEAPLVVKTKQPPRKSTASGKALPQGGVLTRTGG